jgi:hypothetical protein
MQPTPRSSSIWSYCNVLRDDGVSYCDDLKHSTYLSTRAFEGRLVAQEAEDEPASVLLERISVEGVAEPVLFRGQKGVGQGLTRAKTSSSARRR